ncbi:hypothetical protein ZHAS_00008184 [Anopheles sinensis]|uniref:Uncharacterized protein n=1 Tax=Anopheles sinensis TaxID=74873 RepID=A0A084VS12_ANOSI|nr:hypothetical protein ZHAS_00008184 [Anopheles sinensis]
MVHGRRKCILNHAYHQQVEWIVKHIVEGQLVGGQHGEAVSGRVRVERQRYPSGTPVADRRDTIRRCQVRARSDVSCRVCPASRPPQNRIMA